MRGRRLVMLAATGLLLLGCGDSFDEDGLQAIEQWVDDVIPAGEVASGDIAAAALGEEDFWQPLEDHHDELKELYERGRELPDEDEISSWMFNRTVGGEQFTVQGDDLSEAVVGLQLALGDLVDEFEFFLEQDGELDDEDMGWLEDALVGFDEAADAYRDVMLP